MKKLKLSLSICMMCLCIAVLCMGILAAGSASYQINGNISYNMIDGVARINTRVYKVAGDPASESDLQTAVTSTFLTTSSFAVIEANQSPIYAQTYQNKETLEYTDTPTTKDYDINVVYGANNDADAYYTYYVVIQIYNQTETSGYVLNASITKTDGTDIANTDSSYVATNTSVSGVAKDTFSNIVIGISAQTIEKAQTLTNSTESFAYKLSVTYDEVTLPTFDELLTTYTDANSNSYWGVPLGKISSDSETPIIWRYVGDYSTTSDGTETFTRYETYTSTKPTVGSGSVFVQETALADNSVVWGPSSSINYFTTSSLRESIRGGDLFSMTPEEEKYLREGYVKARTLPDIDWSSLHDNPAKFSTFYYPYSNDDHQPLTYVLHGVDYFWLMDVDEIFLYFGATRASNARSDWGSVFKELKWSPGGTDLQYWLRTPCYYTLTTDSSVEPNQVAVIKDGYLRCDEATAMKAVRASFELA